MSDLGDRIRSEADQASRPGQMARLEAIASEVDQRMTRDGQAEGGERRLPRRCEWCAVFVRNDAEPTAWKVRVGYGSKAQQNPRSPWNFWSRLLCPSCANATDSGSWRRVTLAEVERRHAGDWDVTAPYRNNGTAVPEGVVA